MAATALAAGHVLATRKQQRTVAVEVRAVVLPGDAQARGRGCYLYASRGCADCHGADGGGRRFIDNGAFRATGPHISPGHGSVTTGYSAADWVRTVLRRVKPDGRPVLIMPSEDYNRLTDADLAALVAHIQQLPPVAGGAAMLDLPLPVRVMYGLGLVQDAADKIDHHLPPQQPLAEGPTVAHSLAWPRMAATSPTCARAAMAPACTAARLPAAHPTGRKRPTSRPALATR